MKIEINNDRFTINISKDDFKDNVDTEETSNNMTIELSFEDLCFIEAHISEALDKYLIEKGLLEL